MNAKRGRAYASCAGIFADFFCFASRRWTALAEADAAALAEDVLASLAEGDFAAVFENSDAAMQEAVGDADGMAAVWAQITGLLGTLTQAQAEDAGAQGDYRVVLAQCALKTPTRR